MKKSIYFSAIASSITLTFLSTAALADDRWEGEFHHITPNRPGVTLEFCKAHSLDEYKTTPGMVDKEVVAENGVKAKDLGYRVRGVGGVYFIEGTAMLSGVFEGKPWQEKAHYFGHMLQREGGIQHGVWFTKDCKGFYKVGPD